MKSSTRKSQPQKVQHPLSGATLSNWLSLLVQHRGVSLPYLSRALSITAMTLANAPLQGIEALRYGRQIQATSINEPPIFILGHWRSGTTYLHRLMLQDESWGYVSSLQAFVPEAFLTLQQMSSSRLQSLWPEVRLMDNVSYSPTVPEEEDYSLANVSPFSFYCCWYFPHRMEEIFRRSVLLADLSEADRLKWQRSYLKILKKTTLAAGGKRLVIKNPSNTARIAELLKLFPDAKFIHIFRNPFDIYTSTMRFYKKMVPHYALQSIKETEFENYIFSFYRQLMTVYNKTVTLIPPSNFIEICYEDLETSGMTCMEHIYDRLDLPGFEQAQSQFEKYISEQASYQKNQYELDEATKDRVYHQWQEAIDRWTAMPKINAVVS